MALSILFALGCCRTTRAASRSCRSACSRWAQGVGVRGTRGAATWQRDTPAWHWGVVRSGQGLDLQLQPGGRWSSLKGDAHCVTEIMLLDEPAPPSGRPAAWLAIRCVLPTRSPAPQPTCARAASGLGP